MSVIIKLLKKQKEIIMNKKILLLLPALTLVLAGCNNQNKGKSTPDSSGSEEVVGVESVTVTPDTLNLEADQSAILAATVKPITVLNKDVVWSTNNPAVATVDASGKVTAVDEGQAVITATSDADASKKGICTVNVTAPAFKIVKSPVLEKDFVLGAYQETLHNRYFFNGNFVDQSGIRGETSLFYDDAVKMRFEEAPDAEGGEKRYYLAYQKGSDKKYLEMGDDHHVGEVTTPDSEKSWGWDATNFTPTRKIGNTTYFMGCYQTNSTVSGCDIKYVSQDFIFHFLTLNKAVLSGDDYVIPGFTTQLVAAFPDDVTETPVWSITPVGEAVEGKVGVDQNGLVSAESDATVGDVYTVKVVAGEWELEKDITVSTFNYGTIDDPLTVTEAKELIDKQNPTAEPIFVKGTVKKNTIYDFGYNNWQQVWLDGDTKADGFEGYKLNDASTDNEWSYVFAEANTMNELEVVITGIGTTYVASDSSVTYETKGDGTDQLVKVSAYSHSTSLEITPASDFSVEQASSATLTAAFEEGTKDGVLWSVAPVGEADASKVQIDEHGKLSVALDATVGAVYTVTAKLWSDNSVACTVNVTVAKMTSLSFVAESFSASGYSGTTEKTIIAGLIGFIDIGNYGDGIQMRNNNKSRFYNKIALPRAIKNVVITWSSTKDIPAATKNTLNVAFGTSEQSAATSGTKVTWDPDNKVYEYTVTPAAGQTFFSVLHTSTSGAVYLASVVINLVD